MTTRAKNLENSKLDKISQEFLGISKSALKIVDEIIPLDIHQENNFEAWLLTNLLNFSLETSQSLISLVNSSFIKQAFMINRVRLEQTIILSFLIHAKKKEGILPYFLQTGINLHKTHSMSWMNPESGELVDKFLKKLNVDPSIYKDLADMSQNAKNEIKDKSNDKYDREWTNLDLRSMAIKRDKLINDKSYLIAKINLEDYYNNLYKSGSYLIHGEAIFLASSFDVEMTTINQVSLLSNNCTFDLVQIEEVCEFLEIDLNNKLAPLVEKIQFLTLTLFKGLGLF